MDRSFKKPPPKNHRLMEREMCDRIFGNVKKRLSAIEQIEAAWERQRRSPTAQEVDAWITTRRA
jgi:hypothetical protein